MADSTEKTVLINVKIASEEAKTNVGNLSGAINDLAAATASLKKVTESSQAATNAYSEKIAQSKLTVQQMREETARLSETRKQEAIATKTAKDAVVAADGSYKQAQQSLTKLGNAIKSAKDGFTSTSPAIKAQIKEYNDLNTKLKTFDATMGNHQRKVGSYTEALSGINGVLSRLIPGFSQFSSILQDASKGFNVMKGSASQAGTAVTETGIETEAATGGIAAAGIAAAAAIITVIGALVLEGTYLLKFQTYADAASKSWEGVKAGAMSAMNSINGAGKETKKSSGFLIDMAVNIATAFTVAHDAQGKILQTNREINVSSAQTADENNKIREDMLVIRNLKSDEVSVQKAYNEAHKLTVEQYQREVKSQNALHIATVNLETAAVDLKPKELAALKNIEGGYLNILKVAESITTADKTTADFLDKMVISAKKGIEIEGHKKITEELEKNMFDRKQARLDKAAASELTKAEKEKSELAKIKQETEQVESERIASIAKTLDFKREAFAKELSDADEHYRQLIFKQKKFIEDMQVIVDSKKSTAKEKTAARGGIAAANGLIGQLTNEHTGDQQRLLETHSKAILAETQKAANDLAQLQIQGINSIQERERQSENLSYKEKSEASAKELDKLKEDQSKLINDVQTASLERKAILLKELSDNQTLIDVATDKETETQLHHDQKLLDIAKQFEDQKQSLIDQTNILKQKGSNSTGTNDSGVLQAEQTELLNQYARDVSDKTLTDEKKLELEQKYLNDKDALNKAYSQKKKDYDLQIGQQIENAAFSIIQQSMERSNQAFEMNLGKQKTHDLSNQSLTETQKYEINEKYRVLEAKQKIKVFKQEQELALAKGAIDMAAGILKASPNVPLMALAAAAGVLELAVIASQKAPAYAQGGTFKSDGRGSVLPGYSKKDNVNATLRSGEAVVVSEAMRDPWARSIVSAINQSYGGRAFDSTAPINPWVKPGFASGGVFNNYTPTGDNGLRPHITMGNQRMHPDDINGIASAVSNIRFPQMTIDVKDINNQQGILANTIDRRTY